MKGNIKLNLFGSLLIGMIITLVGCARPSYYDDTDAIVNKKNSALFFGSVETNIGDTYIQRVEKFNGIKTIKTIKKSGELSLEINLTILSGRFKIVMVKDDEIKSICEQDTYGIITLNDMEDGTYKLKIVGEDAKFSLDLKIQD
jgi:hypothetical protein